MTDNEFNLIKEQRENLLNKVKEHENRLATQITDFFHKFTQKELKVYVQETGHSRNLEFRIATVFIKENGEEGFGSDFTSYYEPTSHIRDDNKNILKMSCGSIGTYSYEEKPFNVERAILMGEIWKNREEFVSLLDTFIEETNKDYFDLETMSRMVDRETTDRRLAEEERQFNEDKAKVEAKDFVYVTQDTIYKYSLYVDKVCNVNYKVRLVKDYIGKEENARFYSQHIEIKKNILKNHFVNCFMNFEKDQDKGYTPVYFVNKLFDR